MKVHKNGSWLQQKKNLRSTDRTAMFLMGNDNITIAIKYVSLKFEFISLKFCELIK